MIKELKYTVAPGCDSLDISDAIRTGDYDAYKLVLTFLGITTISGEVRLRFVRSDMQSVVTGPVTVTGNKVEYEFASSVIAKPSPLSCWVQFFENNLYTPLKITFSGVEECPTDAGIEDSSEYPELLTLIGEAKTAKDAANQTNETVAAAELLREQGETDRNNAYVIAEGVRNTAYNAAEGARDDAETLAKTARDNTEEQAKTARDDSAVSAEQARQTNFEENEGARQSQADADHLIAAGDHATAGTDHQTAGADHGIASSDHGIAQTDHNTADADHTTAGADHTQAGTDHSTALLDHGVAGTDHNTAGADHDAVAPTIAEVVAARGGEVSLDGRLNFNAKKARPVVVSSYPPISAITVNLSAANAPTTIANSQWVPAILNAGEATGTVNSAFDFVPAAKKKANTYPDFMYAVTTARDGLSVRFLYFGRYLDIKIKGTGAKVRLLINDAFTSAENLSAAPADGNGYRYTVDFGSVDLRKVEIYGENLYFSGISHDGNGAICPITHSPSINAVFVGDSITEGGSSLCVPANAWCAVVSKMLNLRSHNQGAGGTGYIAAGSYGNFLTRMSTEVISKNPDLLLVCGGLNDEAYTADAVYSAATSYFDAIKAQLPSARVIVFSPFSPTGYSTAPQIRRDICEKLRLVALEHEYPFIDLMQGNTYDGIGGVITSAAGGVITGTGNTGSPQISGNASVFISSDGTHPNQVGHRYLGEYAAREIIKILNTL